MAGMHKLRIIGESKIFPMPKAPQIQLPLTFFDLVFLNFPPVQRLFFYEIPDLVITELEELKTSLALTLHHYYPLAGSLKQNSPEQIPEIVCFDDDFVSFTTAVSKEDFYYLSGDHARYVARFQPFLPELVVSSGRAPVFAVQATVFPNAGIAIGTTIHHAIADGSSYTNFMKHWAMTHKMGEQASCSNRALPFFDRSAVPDPNGLREVFFNDLKAYANDSSFEAWDLVNVPNLMLSTFVFSRELLQKLQHRVTNKTSAQCSPNAAATGFVWAGIARMRTDTSNKTIHFGFVNGCRPRTDPPLPSNYFGNCLGINRVEAKRSDLVGDEGAVIAADAIWKVIKSLEHGAFREAENWVHHVYDYAAKRAVTVAGSPKLEIYDVDFGWGRPSKVELVSIQRTGALALTESRGEKGGIEVGLALPASEMELFTSYYVTGIGEL